MRNICVLLLAILCLSSAPAVSKTKFPPYVISHGPWDAYTPFPDRWSLTSIGGDSPTLTQNADGILAEAILPIPIKEGQWFSNWEVHVYLPNDSTVFVSLYKSDMTNGFQTKIGSTVTISTALNGYFSAENRVSELADVRHRYFYVIQSFDENVQLIGASTFLTP